MNKKLVYAAHPMNGGLIFAKYDRAVYVSRIHNAISSSKTWAEFRKAMPSKEYSWVLRCGYDEMGEPRPKSTDQFYSEAVPGYSEGDYPPWLQQEMDSWFPRDLLDKFGELQSTAFNGDFYFIHPDKLKPICTELESRGYVVEPSGELIFY